MALPTRSSASFSRKEELEHLVSTIREFGTLGGGAITADDLTHFGVGVVGVGTNLAVAGAAFNSQRFDTLLLGVEFEVEAGASDGVTIEPVILDEETLLWRRLKVGSPFGVTSLASPDYQAVVIKVGELVEVQTFGQMIFPKVTAVSGSPSGAGRILARPGRTRPYNRNR